MLSARLVHLIESHADELTHRFVELLKTHARTPAFQRLPDHEIHQAAHKVYKNLGAWLGDKSRDQVPHHYEEIGRHRFEAGIPIAQVMYAVVLSKKNVLAYARNNAFGGTPIEIFSEEELVNRIDQFYDDALYYVAMGYQKAMAEAAERALGAATEQI
jgi:hypothetical protein